MIKKETTASILSEDIAELIEPLLDFDDDETGEHRDSVRYAIIHILVSMAGNILQEISNGDLVDEIAKTSINYFSSFKMNKNEIELYNMITQGNA